MIILMSHLGDNGVVWEKLMFHLPKLRVWVNLIAWPDSSVVKNLPAHAGATGDAGFNPWVRKLPWRRKWQHTPVFLPGESHGQRSLAGYSPQGGKRVRHDWVTEYACYYQSTGWECRTHKRVDWGSLQPLFFFHIPPFSHIWSGLGKVWSGRRPDFESQLLRHDQAIIAATPCGVYFYSIVLSLPSLPFPFTFIQFSQFYNCSIAWGWHSWFLPFCVGSIQVRRLLIQSGPHQSSLSPSQLWNCVSEI